MSVVAHHVHALALGSSYVGSPDVQASRGAHRHALLGGGQAALGRAARVQQRLGAALHGAQRALRVRRGARGRRGRRCGRAQPGVLLLGCPASGGSRVAATRALVVMLAPGCVGAPRRALHRRGRALRPQRGA